MDKNGSLKNVSVGYLLVAMAVIIFVLIMAACGSGGGGGEGGAVRSQRTQPATVSGSAVKQAVSEAEVKIFYFDETGNLVEIIAANAPVLTGPDGAYEFVLPKEAEDIAGPLIVKIVGGTMGDPPAAAPPLAAVIVDPAAPESKGKARLSYLSTASSVAAGRLQKQAEQSGAAPSNSDAEEFIRRVEDELGVDLNKHPADRFETAAMFNECVDQNLDLINAPENSPAISEYIDYLIANRASTSGKLDGKMDDPDNPGTDIDADFAPFGNGLLASIFPMGPSSWNCLMCSADKDAIENDGIDYAHLTCTARDAAGGNLPGSNTVTFEITDGRGIISPSNWRDIEDGQAEVNLSSVWAGNLTIEASLNIENGNTIRQRLLTNVTNLVEDVEDPVPPRVVSAGAISNTEVLVTFSEPIRGGQDGAENSSTYSISSSLLPGTESILNALIVKKAELLLPDRTTIKLTTYSMADIEYLLAVLDVKDLSGNTFAPPERDFVPNTITFTGIPPGEGELVDTDGDGLFDNEEQRGWVVTILLANGEIVTRQVTSDPFNADTDGDGISDLDEAVFLTDPRDHDSDDDNLSDFQELNQIYSDPYNQDTDGDTLADGLEFNFFHISPIEADTDGDQIPDADEVTLQNRDPRISDLPLIHIVIGDVALTLKEQFTYTDTKQMTQTESSSTSSTLEQGTSRTYGTSNSETLSSSIEERAQIGFEASFPDISFGVSGEFEITGTEAQEYNTTVSEESSISANEAFNESFEKAQSFESSSEVVREIMDASMRIMVDLANKGDTAFSVANLEISALQQDPFDRSRSVPVATMVPESVLEENGGSSPVFSLGPLVPAIGPIIFQNRSVFPSTVEDLLKDPRGLLFRVTNYDITFEDGRNFAFASQDANDRTARFTIDFGDGRVELFRVAVGTGRIAPFADTNADGDIGVGDSLDNNGDGVEDDGDRIIFDETGNPVGTTMQEVLTSLVVVDYETRVDQAHAVNPTVDTLFRVEDVENDIPGHKAWMVFSSRRLDETTDFNAILIRAGESYTLAYLQDKDDDKLFAREEYLYGSCDGQTPLDPGFCADVADTTDTDADTIPDFDEVRTGVEIILVRESTYLAYSDPRREDSDSDGLSDVEERTGAFGPTDPRKRDTDGDGIPDFDEVNGYAIRFIDDANLTELLPGDEFLADGTTPNPLEAEPFVTDPLNRDSDFDGISDGFEIQLGADPRIDDKDKLTDTDQDGVSDFDETQGFSVEVNGTMVHMTSSSFKPDTDDDGLPDLLEHIIRSNLGISSVTPACATSQEPTGTDTDCDGLLDIDEFNPNEKNPLGSGLSTSQRSEFIGRCAVAEMCTFDLSNFLSEKYGTNLNEEDSDFDDLDDQVEQMEGLDIIVNGEPFPIPAPSSNPLANDSDDDGVNDSEERSKGTNPLEPDTDKDGIFDKDDTDPTNTGRTATFTYQSITLNGETGGCEDGDGSGPEIAGKWQIVGPNGSVADEFAMCGKWEFNDDNNDLLEFPFACQHPFLQELNPDPKKEFGVTFNMSKGDQVIMRSLSTAEIDTDDQDDDITEFEKKFTLECVDTGCSLSPDPGIYTVEQDEVGESSSCIVTQYKVELHE